jgi:hypothetical protein
MDPPRFVRAVLAVLLLPALFFFSAPAPAWDGHGGYHHGHRHHGYPHRYRVYPHRHYQRQGPGYWYRPNHYHHRHHYHHYH